MFEPLPQKPNIKEYEEQILAFWDKEKIFEKSVERSKGKETFVFYEGPPTANAMPHVGHALTRTYKDLFPRYKTMKGFYTPRRAGWDTHGLPVELEVEKELGFKNKQDIEKYGIEKFNQKCRENVWKYKEAWEKLTKRIGFWLDFDNAYITYDPKYVESLWWVIKEFWKRDLLYQDYKVVPYCPRCGTSLSSHELAQGYDTVKDTSVYVKFKVKNSDSKWANTSILSWTTTPWTLPGNVALAINRAHQFVKVEDPEVKGDYLILEENSYDRLRAEGPFKDAKGVSEKLTAKELVGIEYEPLFQIPKLKNENSFKVYPADFVATGDGTGVVHTAVMYGEDDYNLGKEVGLPQHHTVDVGGKFTEEVSGLTGLFVKAKQTEEKIIDYLKGRGNLLATELFEHEYPFCWRCSTPLLYYARESWFVAVSKVRKQLQANNEKINWVPEHIKHGRFGNFLDEAKDWNFSRSRYWGTPLPIWICEKCKHQSCIGSFDELKSESKSEIKDDFDPHRPFVDDVIVKCEKCGGDSKRVLDLVDVWFDSGSMPYAQLHYPFENKEEFDKSFPADFIAEAIDQTRGWFYTLLAVSTLLEKGEPYKNVISFSHVLDDKGQKMSKSKGNVVKPEEVIAKYGADPLRWYLLATSFSSGPRRYSDDLIEELVKGFFSTLWNSHSFFISYANIDNWSAKNLNTKFIQYDQRPVIDKWILGELQRTIEESERSLELFDPTGAVKQLELFLDKLSNWYIRRSRRRFWKSENGQDKESAYQTLYEVLVTYDKLLAPFIPFTSDFFYKTLTLESSVHLVDWPGVNRELVDDRLIKEMTEVREIVAYGLSIRAKSGVKVRQPLGALSVNKNISLSDELVALILDELNIKKVELNKKPSKDSIEEEYVSMDINITPALKSEGIMREIVRAIQGLRKEAGFELSDRITLFYSSKSMELEKVLKKYEKEISAEVLATKITVISESDKVDIKKEVAINGANILFGLKK